MTLQKINWEQIDTTNIPLGSIIDLGSSETELNGIYTKMLYVGNQNLYFMVTGETYNRINSYTSLYNQITGETANRIYNDKLLNDRITGLTLTVTDDITLLYNQITGETASRVSNDKLLNDQITGVTSIAHAKNSDTQLKSPNGNDTVIYTDNGKNLYVIGNIIQSGKTYQTHAEQLYTTKDTIILRDNAVSGIPNSGFTGIVAKKYDGLNDGVLVFDNNGIARVGDMNTITWTGSAQPIATREETPINNGFAYWDSQTMKFKTKLLNNIEYDRNLILKREEIVWSDGFIAIPFDPNTEINNPQLKVRNGSGFVDLTPIITFPSADVNNRFGNTTYQGFYLSDADNLLTENFDIETLYLNYNTGNTLLNNYDSKIRNLGRNIILEENTNIGMYHSKIGALTYMAVYPNSPHELIQTVLDPLTIETDGNLRPSYTLKFAELHDANILSKPYEYAASDEQIGSNPNFLSVGSHGGNSNQYNNSWKVDITPDANTFLSNSIAIGARPDDTTTIQGATSYGFGLEFFEPSCTRQMNLDYPDRTLPLACAEVKINETGYVVTSLVHPTFAHYLSVGYVVWVEINGVKYFSEVSQIISDSQIIVTTPLPTVTQSGVYLWKYESLGYVWGDLDLNFGKVKTLDGILVTNYDGNQLNTFSDNLQIGDEIWLATGYTGTKYYTRVESKPNAWSITVNPQLPILTNDNINLYHRGDPITPNKGEHYWQSPTTTIVAAKFQKIQDATDANWQIVRHACRMTASNSTYSNGVWTTHWDMYRGFGRINVNAAIQYINENYKDESSRKYLADKHEFAHGLNPFLTYDDLLPNSPMSKKMLENELNDNYLPLSGGTVNGNVTSNSFIKNGGTSSQFLKADGSVDNKSYVTLSDIPSQTITENIRVSLSGGKTLGKYSNGQTIMSSGMTVTQLFKDIAIEALPPTVPLSSSTTIAFNQTSISNILNFSYTINSLDAHVQTVSLDWRRGNTGSWTTLTTNTGLTTFTHTYTDSTGNTSSFNYRYVVTDSVGGVATGTTNITPTAYVSPSIGSISVGSTTRDLGNINTTITATITKNSPNVSLSTYKIQRSVNNGSYSDINGTLTNISGNSWNVSYNDNDISLINSTSISYRIVVTDIYSTTNNTSSTINFTHRSFLGYSTNTVLNLSQILSLSNSTLTNSKSNTISNVTAGDIDYTYYVYASSAGDLTKLTIGAETFYPANGEVFSKLSPDVTGTNQFGANVSYRVYKSNAIKAFTNSTLAFE